MSLEFKLHQHTERYPAFPKSQLHGPLGDLELYLLEDEEMFDHDNLPPRITSTSINNYVNWIHSLQFTDPEERERGSSIFWKYTDELIFPQKPFVGDLNGVSSYYKLHKNRMFPGVRTHSHIDSTAFSFQDLKNVITKEDGHPIQSNFVAELVGTSRQNYLLLRTNQTEFGDKDAVDSFISPMERGLATVIERIKIEAAKRYKNPLDNLALSCINAEYVKIFGTDFPRYYYTFVTTMLVASEFKIGFYMSEKDGIYKLVSQEDRRTIQDLGAIGEQRGEAKFIEIVELAKQISSMA